VPNQAKSGETTGLARTVKTVVLSAAVVGAVVVTASVIAGLWFPTRARAAAAVSNQPSSEELLRCNRDVSELLEDLAANAARLVTAPDDPGSPATVSTRWTQFSRQWQERWHDVDARCRFSELAGTRLGVGYDRMARVHDTLQETHLRYDSLIRRFDNEQADELSSMRRALTKSRGALSRTEGASQGH